MLPATCALNDEGSFRSFDGLKFWMFLDVVCCTLEEILILEVVATRMSSPLYDILTNILVTNARQYVCAVLANINMQIKIYFNPKMLCG